jgi:hypothetical protein
MENFNELVIDKRAEEIFKFLSKAKRLGIYLLVSGIVGLVFYSILSMSITLISLIFIILIIMGLINILNTSIKSFLSNIIICFILTVVNIILLYFTKNFEQTTGLFIQLIIIVTCIKIYRQAKNLNITIEDRENYSNLIKLLKKGDFKKIRIKQYNAIESKIMFCVIVDNLVLITNKYYSELYVTNKEAFSILDSKEKYNGNIKGKYILNGEAKNFIMHEKAFNSLKLQLEQ